MARMIKRIPSETSSGDDAKVERDVKTAGLMIDLYCRDHHGSTDQHCRECRELFDYVKKRLALCPLKDKKPKCSKCPVHCYKPDMKEKIKAVMRYSGPRMIYRHPLLTAKHYLNEQ